MVGVPPSKGRGGNQTPRSESISIHSSQPLPSPSSSFGSSPMLDKLAFGMSKIDGEGSGSKPGSVGSGGVPAVVRETRHTGAPAVVGGEANAHANDASTEGGDTDDTDEAGERLSNMSIDSHGHGFDKKATPHPLHPPGPSLLTQQMAPSHTLPVPIAPAAALSESDVQLSTSVMSVDSNPSQSFGDETSSSSLLEGNERITVKIADLGNGGFLILFVSVFSIFRE